MHICAYADLMRSEYNFSKAKRGPVVLVPRGTTRITIRLDEDVLAWFREQVHKAGRGSYQNLINDALRQHIGRAKKQTEADDVRRSSAPHGSPTASPAVLWRWRHVYDLGTNHCLVAGNRILFTGCETADFAGSERQ